jgi:hypothetical protein
MKFITLKQSLKELLPGNTLIYHDDTIQVKLFINKIKKEAKGYLDYHSIQRINGWTFVIIEIEVKIDVLSKLLGKIK